MFIRLVTVCTVAAIALAACAESAGTYRGSTTSVADQGYDALKAGNFASAASYYEQALSVDGSDAYAVLNLGVAYENLGKTDLARAQYQQAINVGEDVYPEWRYDSRYTDEAELRGALSIADIARANLASLGFRTSALPRLRASVN